MTGNTARRILQKAITEAGGNGLCNPGEDCGCGIDDMSPAIECLNLDECYIAKWVVPKLGEVEYENEDYRDGYYRVMECQ